MLSSYPSIFNLGHRAIKDLFLNQVIIEEKIDGSQISFGLGDDGELYVRSKGAPLNFEAPDKMFAKAIEFIKSIGPNLPRGYTFRGEYLCLSGDTRVKKASGGQHDKYMTLKTLYELQNAPPNNGYKRKTQGQRKPRISRLQTRWEKEGFPSLYSLDLRTDEVVKNCIRKVVATGEKPVYKLTTRKGFQIKTSSDHKFWTPKGWLAAILLKPGDCVGIVNDSSYKRKRVLYGVEYSEVKRRWDILKEGAVCFNCGTSFCLEIHHKDQDRMNNAPGNLQVLCSTCHKKTPKSTKRLAIEYEFDSVVSFEPLGTEFCYDVEMAGEEELASFVAEGFLVHNCKPKHNVLVYDRVPQNNIIIFDIEEQGSQNFLNWQHKHDLANGFGMETVPLLFVGMVNDPKTLRELFQIQSILGGQKVEGVVIKPLHYDLFGLDKKVLMGKFVSEEFKEVHGATWKAEHGSKSSRGILERLSAELATPARWQKAVVHLREAGKIEDSPSDIGRLILAVKEDIKKECTEYIMQELLDWSWPQLQRACVRGLPEWYKERLLALQFEKEEPMAPTPEPPLLPKITQTTADLLEEG